MPLGDKLSVEVSLPRFAVFQQLGGGGSEWIVGEIPAGIVNGVNRTFTSQYNFSVVMFYLNGIRVADQHWQITSSNSLLIDDAPLAGDEIFIDYVRV